MPNVPRERVLERQLAQVAPRDVKVFSMPELRWIDRRFLESSHQRVVRRGHHADDGKL
jgi:hypothetical protein